MNVLNYRLTELKSNFTVENRFGMYSILNAYKKDIYFLLS